MNYNSTPLYIKLTFLTPKTIFLLPLLLMGMVGYAQQSALLDNRYTPLTTDVLSGLTVTSSTTVLGDEFSPKGNVINANLTDNASWDPLLGGSAWIEVKDNNATGSEEYPAGSYAGFVIGNDGLLNLLGNSTITTYLGNNAQESVSGSSLLSIGLLSNTARAGFITTMPFDRIRLTVSALG